jgi:hypothetical protein
MTGEFLEYEELMKKLELECREYQENLDWFRERVRRLSA